MCQTVVRLLFDKDIKFAYKVIYLKSDTVTEKKYILKYRKLVTHLNVYILEIFRSQNIIKAA